MNHSSRLHPASSCVTPKPLQSHCVHEPSFWLKDQIRAEVTVDRAETELTMHLAVADTLLYACGTKAYIPHNCLGLHLIASGVYDHMPPETSLNTVLR